MEADASGSRSKKKQQKLGGGDRREGRVRFVPLELSISKEAE